MYEKKLKSKHKKALMNLFHCWMRVQSEQIYPRVVCYEDALVGMSEVLKCALCANPSSRAICFVDDASKLKFNSMMK